MKTVRYGSFETNSSSTHAIVVPKQVNNDEYSLHDSLDHDYAFGREECRLCCDWDEKLAYTYLALKDLVDKKTIKNFKDKVIKVYNNVLSMEDVYESIELKAFFDYLDSDRDDGNITGDDFFYVLKPRYGKFVDHSYMLKDIGFIERILNDEEFLKRFIFNRESYITVCGDEYRGYNIKTIGFEYDYNELYYVNKKGEKPPKEWFDEKGRIKKKYWDKYNEEYNVAAGGFWDKLKEYEKDNEVFLKGN